MQCFYGTALAAETGGALESGSAHLAGPGPEKARKMQAISRALNNTSETKPVFYVDEVDINLKQRIGP